MKIFITGNLGFIGTRLTALLIESGHSVIGYDIKQAGKGTNSIYIVNKKHAFSTPNRTV